MNRRRMKRFALVLAAVLCVSMALSGCSGKEEGEFTSPSRQDKPIVPQNTLPNDDSVSYTPVYASVFEDTVVLATVPVEEYSGLEPSCEPREISRGGRILCGGEHESEIPLTRVLIIEKLVPHATCGWFRDMARLEVIQGLEGVDTRYVTDMSYMFSGCKMLTELDIDDWDVSNVTDMTGMFDGCTAMAVLPAWYDMA